ncbi:MAG TPA: DNA-binding protein, partial [Clostridiaceae bacterium]|nr:DNA-binding protein [Clostridiaceae bacterium]
SSKNYFKIALGNLMKKGLIRQDEKGTYLVEK